MKFRRKGGDQWGEDYRPAAGTSAALKDVESCRPGSIGRRRIGWRTDAGATAAKPRRWLMTGQRELSVPRTERDRGEADAPTPAARPISTA